MPGRPPCHELRDWYAARLRPRLLAAVERGVADAGQVVVLERDLGILIAGASPCRDGGDALHPLASTA